MTQTLGSIQQEQAGVKRNIANAKKQQPLIRADIKALADRRQQAEQDGAVEEWEDERAELGKRLDREMDQLDQSEAQLEAIGERIETFRGSLIDSLTPLKLLGPKSVEQAADELQRVELYDFETWERSERKLLRATKTALKSHR